jgi:hypothetical protein
MQQFYLLLAQKKNSEQYIPKFKDFKERKRKSHEARNEGEKSMVCRSQTSKRS